MTTNRPLDRVTAAPLSFLMGEGEMAERIRTFDWESTPLGPPDSWPQSLKTSLSICLTSRFPLVVWWTAELRVFYNDAWRPVLGQTKHPAALGAPGKEVWPEIWQIIGPQLESALAEGVTTWKEDQLLLLDRNGYLEEAYFTYSYSPIAEESGHIGGVLSVVQETTRPVIEKRRLGTLRHLASRAVGANSVQEAAERAVNILSENPVDVPFAVLYLVGDDGKTARLASHSGGLDPIYRPEAIDLSDGNEIWPLQDVIETSESALVDISNAKQLPGGYWDQAPTAAIVLPIGASGQKHPAILVAGINPRREFDDEQKTFFALVSSHIASALAGAMQVEEERKRLEALAEIDRAKTTFFSNVSHEFRTPLTLIMGPLHDALAGDLGPLPQRAQDELNIAHRNTLRLQKLVNALLDFSRFEAGRVQAFFAPTEFAKFNADIASTFRSAMDRAGLGFVIDCESDARVYLDRSLWEKVVLNLISNALKHTFDGSVRVTCRIAENAAQLEVADTGVGISAEQLPRIFDRFHRVAGSRARTHEGSGIGLALAFEIAKIHGGSISAQSSIDDQNHGTVFTVTVPLGHAHLPSDQLDDGQTDRPESGESEAFLSEALRWTAEDEIQPEQRESANNQKTLTPGVKASIVLADDNADMRGYVSRLLASDFTIRAYGDGAKALRAIREEKPDLVLTDVMMPVLDGFGLLSAIRSDASLRDMPVVVLSARAGEEATVEGLTRGADDYLVKPFSGRELIARIESVIRLSQLRKDNLRTVQQLADELDERVRRRTDDLLQANEQLQGFTYSVAHDLRQQIRGISTNAALVLEDAGQKLDEESKAHLGRLIKSARQLSALVDDLLNYARLVRQQPNTKQIDLTAMAEQVKNDLKERDACRADTEFVIQSGLKAVGDPTMISLVIENLFDNACKYSSKKDKARVEFGRDKAGFYVRDNGIGFDMAYVGKLFTPFERLHSDANYAGTGIGLANVKRIVEKHGGKVWAESIPNQGATFWFTL